MSEYELEFLDANRDDDLDAFVDQAMSDPAFRAVYEDAQERHSIIDSLVSLRRRLRLTQSTVATRMKVRQPTVSGFETEDSDPRLSTLQRYARAVEARLRVVVVVPSQCDWIGPSASPYQVASVHGSTGAEVRNGGLANEWRAEKRRDEDKVWAASA
jgi:transcriptional regulator with XRE-family HTH domain